MTKLANRAQKFTGKHAKARDKFKGRGRKRINETFANGDLDESASSDVPREQKTILRTKPSYKGLDGDDDSEEAYIPSDGDSSKSNDEDESNSSSDDDRKPRRVAELKNAVRSTSRSSALSSLKKFNSTSNVRVNSSISTEDQESSNEESSKQRSSDEETGTSQSEKCVDMKCSDSDIFSREETDEEEGASVCHDQCCQSKYDAITNEPLEDIHVCWITPDGESRQCYNLDTLRKVSLAKRTNNLLEPPHFRSHLSVELKEQIISKFGRSGLIVEEHDYVDGDEYFHDRFTHYMTTLMGSRDIYVCPICYCYKYKSISEAEDDEQFHDIISSRSFKHDPMSVLSSDEHGGSADDGLRLASSFCFRLVADIKEHLGAVHNVDFSHISGNDLFKGYQIRAADGLLQRWLKNNVRTVNSTSMRRYWAEGNNLDFIELCLLVDHPRGDSANQRFFDSFADQVETLWETISGAFASEDEEELEDFIVNEGSETESIESGPRNIHAFSDEDCDVEEEFVKKLREKRGADSSASSRDSRINSSDESSLATEDDLEVGMDSHDSGADGDSEEEDEWLTQKLATPKTKLSCSPKTHTGNASSLSSGKRSKLRKLSAVSHREDDESDNEIAESFASVSDEKAVSPQHGSSTKKKRLIIDELEDSD